MDARETAELMKKTAAKGPAPEKEPERQYYFMEKASLLVRGMKEEAGRDLTFYVKTFGCQMNARDSEKLSGILTAIGYVPAQTEKADFVVYNTCTVRENADNHVYGRLGYLNGLKKKNPHMMIALCGCMMQEKAVVDKIRKSYRFVDLIFGTHNLYQFAELFVEAVEAKKMTVEVRESPDEIVENLPNRRKYPFKSGVNVTYGCNNFCSYCIVPYVRGRERSRRPEEILDEIRDLAQDGVVEIMLLGQNVNSYGKTLDPPVTFAELLREAEKIEGIERIRFMTSHPKDLSDDLIGTMASSRKICRHIHLPLQSGSTRVLEAMNRRYTKEQYLALVDRIRAAMPDISITTDIIVGFPGETEEDFQETLDVVERVRFDSAFTFLYSKRTGTPAASMENQVPEETAKERFGRLLDLVQQCGRGQSERWTGTVQKVLVESVNEQDPSLVTGRMDNNSVVHFPGGRELIGKIVDVRLAECRGFYYIGERI